MGMSCGMRRWEEIDSGRDGGWRMGRRKKWFETGCCFESTERERERERQAGQTDSGNNRLAVSVRVRLQACPGWGDWTGLDAPTTWHTSPFQRSGNAWSGLGTVRYGTMRYGRHSRYSRHVGYVGTYLRYTRGGRYLLGPFGQAPLPGGGAHAAAQVSGLSQGGRCGT
jgi:hypothetical protein